MEIREVSTQREVNAVAGLFREYAAWLGVDLCFQGFAEELASLPGRYASPRGRLLIAWSGNEPAGCVALRPLSDTTCEMKRLFVKPAFRGQRLGRRLAERVIADARIVGYSCMCLDTLPLMETSIVLYEALGFVHRAAYYDTLLLDTVFMELQL